MRELEAVYRSLWRAWCGESPAASQKSKQAMFEAALTAINKGDMLRTIAVADEALAAHPVLPEVRQLRGIAYYRLGNVVQGVADLLEAIKDSPTQPTCAGT